MNSKLALVLATVLFVGPFTAGCAVSSKADSWSGGGIPSIVATGQDTSSERGSDARLAARAPIDRGDARDHVEPRPVPLHEAMICARCSR